MTRRGPLFTLLAGGAFGAILLAASINATPANDEQGELVAGATPSTGTPTPEPSLTPDPDLTPDPSLTPDPTDPGEDEDAVAPDPVSYVGFVDGGGTSVAIIVTGDEATAYVCDGDQIEVWLNGSAAGGELDLTGPDQEQLTGTYDDAAATGEVVVGDLTFTFAAGQVDEPEGLYRVAETIVGGARVEGGWIVLPDGTQVGVARVNGEPRSAPLLNPRTGEVVLGGELVVAERVGRVG